MEPPGLNAPGASGVVAAARRPLAAPVIPDAQDAGQRGGGRAGGRRPV